MADKSHACRLRRRLLDRSTFAGTDATRRDNSCHHPPASTCSKWRCNLTRSVNAYCVRWALPTKMRFFVAFTAWLALSAIPGWAEMLSFDSAEKWQSWTIPAGLVQVDAEGVLRLTKYRKEVDAIRDAHLFTHSTQKRGEVAGGIWQVGSGSATATNAIDGDPTDLLAARPG